MLSSSSGLRVTRYEYTPSLATRYSQFTTRYSRVDDRLARSCAFFSACAAGLAAVDSVERQQGPYPPRHWWASVER
jgi:hypothetical protein